MNFFAIYYPYALKKLSTKVGIVLNRFYQPLGHDRHPGFWCDYNCAPGKFFIRLPWGKLATMFDYTLISETDDLIFLYGGDSGTPFCGGKFIYKNWVVYAKKLAKLAKLKFVRDDPPSRSNNCFCCQGKRLQAENNKKPWQRTKA